SLRRARDPARRGRHPHRRPAARLPARAHPREGPGAVRRHRRGAGARSAGGGAAAHAAAGVPHQRAAHRLRDRLLHLPAVPRHRPGGRVVADLDADDRAAADDRVAAVQADAVRAGRRLEPDRGLAGARLRRARRMTIEVATALLQETIRTSLWVTAPVLLGVLTVGLALSVLQTATQINDQTITFVPKIVTA